MFARAVPRIIPTRTHGAVFGVTLGCVQLLSTLAHADTKVSDAATKEAEQAFDEGVQLVAKGSYAEACPKFERSQTLDPAIGTQFNLADCKEHTGKLATALLLFEKVAQAAHESGKREREKEAEGRAAALRLRVPRLTIKLGAAAPGLAVTLDEAPLALPPPASIPVDPGEHVVRATAPSRLPFVGRATVAERGQAEVVVPELAASATEPARPAVTESDGKTQRVVAIGLGVVGLAGVGVGSAFGLSSMGKRDDAIAACGSSDPKACRPGPGDPAALWGDATTAGNISTIAFAVGGVALAGAVVLWILAPSSKREARSAQLVRGITF